MAHTVLTGNLGKDPELKATRDGKPMLTLSVAWSENSRDANGQWAPGPTVWVSARVFGRQAENAAESLHKGCMVTVSGQLKPETWSSDHGEETRMTMMADTIAPALFTQVANVRKPDQQQAQQTQQQSNNWQPQNNTGGAWSQPPAQAGGFGSKNSEVPF